MSVPATTAGVHAGIAKAAWPVQVFAPFPDLAGFVFGRAAARSPAFPANDAAGGHHVLVGSAAGYDRADVAVRAGSELAERVHNVLAGYRAGVAPGSVVAAYHTLRRAGRPALDPVELGCHPDMRGADLLWVVGRSLLSGDDVLVPACTVFLAHRPPGGCAAPVRAGSTGTAAHPRVAEAVRHAVVEVLERDLLWDAWYREGARSVLTGPPPLPPALAHGLRALGLSATFLYLADRVDADCDAGCVLACLHTAHRTEQSFGARATSSLDTFAHAAEAAVHEALMVRWSMGTPAAHAAWLRMRNSDEESPFGAVEHALHTFHRQDSLAHLLDGSTRRPWPKLGAAKSSLEGPSPAGLLAARTGGDVVVVDTTVDTIGPEGTVVVRVVAEGAHRLPADERAQPAPAGARTRLPHPLG
jgi:ribosomal protein S12 methylthiotransferase accessory factor